MGATLRVVDEARIREAVGPAEALTAAEEAFRALAEGRVSLPPPLGLLLPEVEGEVHVKGARIAGAPLFAFKVATGFYRNAARGLPTGAGLVLVFDADTGFPLGLLEDGGYLTDLRTAAAGALAARLLARDDRPLEVGVLGAGTQARFQLRALSAVREVAAARVWSRSAASVDALREALQDELDFPLAAAATPQDAVGGADLVLTLTPARRPLVEPGWLAPGSTVVAVGSDGEGKQELAARVVAEAGKVVTDLTVQCARLGELQHPLAAGLMGEADVHAELGEVLVGRRPGREGDEIIVCDLTGVGAQDAAIAEAAWTRLG